MKITQISVFLENKQGRLHEACALLGEAGVNIRALHIAETADYGVLRMVVDQTDRAIAVLKEHGLVANRTDVVVVEVGDHPGGLAAVLKVLQAGGINVEYMYGFLERKSDHALLVFRFDDADAAMKVLAENRIRTVNPDVGL